VASGLAIDRLADAAGRSRPPSLDELVATIERSNSDIRREARSQSDLVGMGTTCTVVVIDEAIGVAHVGDSRAYRFREDELVQLTDDHSLVASMVRQGLMAPADAMADGRRNIITRALGADDAVSVDVVTVDRRAGDRLLLCSDGLHGQVDDAAIAAVLREEADPNAAADRLVELANAAGGDDNVTVIVIDVDANGAADPDAPPDSGPRRPRRVVLRAVLLVIAVIAVIAVALAIWLWVTSTRAV
jgi:protein phosphatase